MRLLKNISVTVICALVFLFLVSLGSTSEAKPGGFVDNVKKPPSPSPEFPTPLPGEDPAGGYVCTNCKYHHGVNWGIAPDFNLRRRLDGVRGRCPNCSKNSVWYPVDAHQEFLPGYKL